MKWSITLSVTGLAMVTLLYESTLIRFMAVAQFYHFSFLVISLALLGFGASGSILYIFPRLQNIPIEHILGYSGIGFACASVLAYGIVNLLPFDSYSIAWDRKQIIYFFLYYLSLTIPFIFSGLGISAALSNQIIPSHIIYAANLFGSAAGVLIAPLIFAIAGVPGAIIACCLMGFIPPLLYKKASARWLTISVLFLGILCLGLLSVLNFEGIAWKGMVISPYKGLSYANRFPNSKTLFSQWNTFSYITVISNAGTRALPGLSYMASSVPPEQSGLSIDADTLIPITLVSPENFDAAHFMPESIAFSLNPGANVLVLDAGGGLGILQALAEGAVSVTATVHNPLIPEAISHAYPENNIFSDPRVHTYLGTSRVFLSRDQKTYEVVYLPLTDPYRPITSGAYSLSENYTLTVEAYAEILKHISPGGILIVTRWLQTPPSESIRIAAILAEAFNNFYKSNHTYVPFSKALVAYRGIQTISIVLKPNGWEEYELHHVRKFAKDKRYDLVWAPDILPDDTNQFNILPEPVYYQLIKSLISTSDPQTLYKNYPYAITPPTDDKPFFFHFFKWKQLEDIFANLGKKWQPFGGSGYLVLFALLGMVGLLSSALIAVPLFLSKKPSLSKKESQIQVFAYFSLIGVAYLFIEIPLIQRSILVLGNPTYAFTTVALTLLLFSSLGSALARKTWIDNRGVFIALVLFSFLTPFEVAWLGDKALSWSPWLRSIGLILSLAPLAMSMGFPFPLGLIWLEQSGPDLKPWAWVVNGCASVIASVLAAILAISLGYSIVLFMGCAAYGSAAIIKCCMSKKSWGLAG